MGYTSDRCVLGLRGVWNRDYVIVILESQEIFGLRHEWNGKFCAVVRVDSFVLCGACALARVAGSLVSMKVSPAVLLHCCHAIIGAHGEVCAARGYRLSVIFLSP